MYYNIYVYNLESRARTPPLDLSILYYSVHFVHLLIGVNTMKYTVV